MKCGHKGIYHSKAGVERARTRYQRGGNKLHIYKCKACKGYHLSKFRKAILYSTDCAKHIYGDKRDAELAAEQMREKGYRSVEVYRCKDCKGWHWGGFRK